MTDIVDTYRQTLAMLHQLADIPEQIVMPLGDLVQLVQEADQSQQAAYESRGLTNLALEMFRVEAFEHAHTRTVLNHVRRLHQANPGSHYCTCGKQHCPTLAVLQEATDA